MTPNTVRCAGLVVAVEGVIALIVAIVLVVRAVRGADQHVDNGYGTAAWFLVIGGAVLAAGWALVTGRRWGRGIAVVAQLLFLPVAWYLGVGSHQLAYGIGVALAAVVTLGLLVTPSAMGWASGRD